MEEWGFIWLMFAMKLPIAALLLLVWWAIRQSPDTVQDDEDDGGIGKPLDPHPRRPSPPRRRGPHGEPVVPSPPRVRTGAEQTTTRRVTR